MKHTTKRKSPVAIGLFLLLLLTSTACTKFVTRRYVHSSSPLLHEVKLEGYHPREMNFHGWNIVISCSGGRDVIEGVQVTAEYYSISFSPSPYKGEIESELVPRTFISEKDAGELSTDMLFCDSVVLMLFPGDSAIVFHSYTGELSASAQISFANKQYSYLFGTVDLSGVDSIKVVQAITIERDERYLDSEVFSYTLHKYEKYERIPLWILGD